MRPGCYAVTTTIFVISAEPSEAAVIIDRDLAGRLNPSSYVSLLT